MNRYHSQLQQLRDALNKLSLMEQSANKKQLTSLFPLQEPQFRIVSQEPQAYIDEIAQDLEQLAIKIEQQCDEQWIDHLCQQLSAKFKSLFIALQKLNAPAQQSRAPNRQNRYGHNLYAQLARQQEYERSLMDMIREREQLHPSTIVQREIVALKERLARCKSATRKIEDTIMNKEKRSR